MNTTKYTTKNIENFWKHVCVSDDYDSCWEWTAGFDNKGYGQMRIGSAKNNTRRMVKAHRVAYEITNGIIPEGLSVLHTCDNPKCVNPQHLFVGTQADNMRDMVNKGRQAKPHQKLHNVLTENDVLEIRGQYVPYSHDRNVYTLAKEYGVSPSLISKIVRLEMWKGIGE